MKINLRTGFDTSLMKEFKETVVLTQKEAQSYIQDNANRWNYEFSSDFARRHRKVKKKK
jgi:hypothetical protein